MSAPGDCCTPSCPTTPPVNIPGVPGEDGAPGADGAAGGNAYTFTTANFTIPAINANVTIAVGDSSWMVIGQTIWAGDGTDGGTFTVVTIPASTSVTLKFIGASGDSAPGAVVNSGAGVSPAGAAGTSSIPNPLTIALGGTSSATKANAQVALGVGQNATVKNLEAIGYDITNSAATITGMTLTVPTTGLYLIMAHATVDYSGATFAAARVLTLKIRNTTAGSDVTTTARSTEILTTTSLPSLDYSTPFLTASLTAAHVLALQIDLSVVESAGSSKVSAASLIIVPLAL